MEVEILEKTENPILRRIEVKFRVDHKGGPTPRRLDVRSQLASKLNVDEELVVIERIKSSHGRQLASGIARAYATREQLEALEPEHLLKRGIPKEAEKPKSEPRS